MRYLEEILLGITVICVVILVVLGFTVSAHPAPKPSISYCVTHGPSAYTWNGTDYQFSDLYMPCKWLNKGQDV